MAKETNDGANGTELKEAQEEVENHQESVETQEPVETEEQKDTDQNMGKEAKQKRDSKKEQEQDSLLLLQKENEELAEELAKYKEMALRSRADYENLKRRGERQKEETKNWFIREIAKGILEATDDFENALHTIGQPETKEEKAEKFDSIIEGIELVLNKIYGLLENYGVEETGKEGETFDPRFHEGLQMMESPDVEGEKIGMVFQKGYRINEFSLRNAKVQVLKGKKPSTKQTKEQKSQNQANENASTEDASTTEESSTEEIRDNEEES